MNYKSGGSTVIRNVISELSANNAHYVLVLNTDCGIATTYKIVDGYFVGERNSQSTYILPW